MVRSYTVANQTTSYPPLLGQKSTTSPISLSYYNIPATLCHNQLSIPLHALVNTGTEDSFLCLPVASQSGLPLEQLDPL